MAATINIPVYSDVLVVLGTAGIVVPLVQRFGLNPVLGYLGAGAVLGPLGLGSFISQVPILYWLTVVDAKNVGAVADLGVVFLLFLIGLELSLERLRAMRRLVFGLGGAQVVLTSMVLAAIIAVLGQGPVAALILGACLALSSTAVVLDVLSRSKRMVTSAGRASFAVLLAQDLAVIPLLMFVAVLGTSSGLSLGHTVAVALAQAAAAVAIIVAVGRVVLRPLYRLVASSKSSELFIATTLFIILVTGVIAAAAGLSMALGAFIAGLMLAETEYRKAIEVTVEPFKGLLLGIFFFTVGMAIDVREVLLAPMAVLAAVVGLVVVKAAIIYGLAQGFRLTRAAATETAALLAPGGEFAFVVIGLAVASGLLEPRVASFAVVVTALSMVLIPVLGTLAQRAALRIDPGPALDPALLVTPEHQTQHAIVVGHGRVGKTVCRLLAHHGVPYIAIDDDPRSVAADRAAGLPVYYGHAGDARFLSACGLESAASVIITTHTRSSVDRIVEVVRAERPELAIVSRALDADHARHLYAIGVTDAVPETVEASLQLSEAALVGLGVATGPVIASIHEERDVVRRALQAAAEGAGRPAQRGVRERSQR